MKNTANDENRLVRYLLGQMPQEEQAEIEERYLADPDFHQELRAAERDLIDRYVHGELVEREQFEKSFLASPRRRQKVEFARALMRTLDKQQTAAERPQVIPERSSWWTAAVQFLKLQTAAPAWIAAAAAIVILAGVWLLMRGGAEQTPNPMVQTPPQQQPEVPPTPPPGPTPAPVRVATFFLTPGLVRSAGDETPVVTVEANVGVSLQLLLESADFKTYRAVIRTAEGSEVWRQDQLTVRDTASGQAVAVDPPVGRLNAGDYTVRLSGVTAGGQVEDVSSYYFRAVTR
jgi:hypothetical protein